MLDFSAFERPRLRVIAATPGLQPGGAEMWLSTLVKRSQLVKYTCVVSATWVDNHQFSVGGVPVLVSGDSTNAQETAEKVATKVLEAVNTHGADLVFYWGFIRMPLDQLDVPLVHVSHSSGVELTDWHKVHMGQYGNSRANFLTAVSQSASQFFSEEVRQKEKVFVVHNGSDVERVKVFIGRNEQRKLWGIPEDAKVMLFLGRFSTEKNPMGALDAMQHLPDDWYAVFYGWGILQGPLFDRAKESSFAKRVLFPQARLSGLGDVYAAADVVVIPSQTEAFPLVLIEAWQAGIPVVCSEFATLKEIEEEYARGNELAWHVPCPPTPQELATAVASIGDGDDRITMAQQIAENSFSATAMVGRWERLFYHCVREWQDSALRGLVHRVVN